MTQPRDPLGTGDMNDFDPHNSEAGCPPATVWAEIVAGTVSEEIAMAYLSHTASCDRCGDLLAKAMPPDLRDATPDEEAILTQLGTAKTAGQHRLAAMMFAAAHQPDQATSKPRAQGRLLRWPILTLAVAAALALAGYFALPYLRPASDEQLLARAYDHHRVSELRIPGSAAVALASPTRGASSDPVGSSELFKVKLRAQQKFEQTPNDPALRQTLGEIAIVEHDGETARREFEMAEALNPTLPRLKLDMASAYFELAESKGHALDYARAIDFYGQYLQDVHQQDPVALFDRGLCWERQSVNAEAIKDFEAALALEKNDAWRKEIQRHIDTLKAQSAVEDAAPIPLTPANFLSLQAEAPGAYEQYLDAAGRQWLSHRAEPETASALDKLAALGAEKHQDVWLRDFLAAPVFGAADDALARALQANAKGDSDTANAASAEAVRLYQQAHNQPGLLRASAEHVYSLQRMGRAQNCVAEAEPLVAMRQINPYSWMKSYLQLEISSCHAQLAGGLTAALREASSAVETSGHASLAIINLRALGFVAEDRMRQKEANAAWTAATSGLANSYPVKGTFLRRYQFLFALKGVADSLDLKWTKEGLSEASVAESNRAANVQVSAYALEGLGVDQTRIGAFEDAAQTFRQADAALAKLGSGKTQSQYQADWMTDRVALRVQQSHDLGPVIHDIAALEATYQTFDSIYPRIRYFTEYSDALRRSNRVRDAVQTIWPAIATSEKSLADIHTQAARQSWDDQAARAYRVLVVDLAAGGQAGDALRAWEWFKGASHRDVTVTRVSDSIDATIQALPPIPAEAPGSLTLVYARLDDRYVAWSIDASQSDPIRMRILPQSAKVIEDKGIALRRLCADPSSSLQDIHTLSASLYSDLVAPFADQIDHAGTVQLELDPALASVPFGAISKGKLPLGVEHPLVFLREGWALDHNENGGDKLTDQTQMLVLREAVQPGAAIIPGEYDESIGITHLFPQAHIESAALWRSGSTLDIDGPSTLGADLARANVIHYTGHGLDEAKGNPDPKAQQLTLGERSLLHCQLAVLAACRTLDQRENLVEDVPSFARILFDAGARTVLATQWDVDCRVTQKLMVRFYAELANHQTFAEALRRAQMSIQADPEVAHPYYWSAFQLVGNPTPTARGKS